MARPESPDDWTDFDRIRQLVTELGFKFQLQNHLFSASPETVSLLNATAPEFFGRIQAAMQLDLLRHLAALLDPASSGKQRENLSIRRRINHAADWIDDTTRGKLESQVSRSEEHFKKIKAHRDKTIAHFDREVLLGEARLDPLIKTEVRQSIETIFTAMNIIEAALFGSSTVYDQPIARAPADIVQLLQHHRWYASVRRLALQGSMSDQELAQVIKGGRRGIPWLAWCKAHGIEPTAHEQDADNRHDHGRDRRAPPRPPE